MRWQRLRLILAAVLFLAWAGWLAYQALTTADPIVVSRPQILLAPVVIEANVPDEPGVPRQVTVLHVYRGQALLGLAADVTKPQGLLIVVSNFGEAHGQTGAGKYLLALEKIDLPDGASTYNLVPLPPSPGFPPRGEQERLKPRVYPSTESTRLQVREALRLNAAP